jgi:hypothetical protein
MNLCNIAIILRGQPSQEYGSTWPISTLIIIFRNVEIFNKNLRSIFFLEENKESDGILGNMSFVKMES